jgi:hypothetical protein
MADQQAAAAPLPQGAVTMGHTAHPELEGGSQRGHFDGQTFLADNGLTLVGAGANDGEVRVNDSYGNPATLNMKKIMGQAGINPNETDIQMNSPDTAVQTSPVGFGDRIRLALGNAKGQIDYLKANYQDAQLKDGDLYVKDKGVWHTVDPSGLGDGNGWDIAKEFAGDIADLTKDAIVGTGQVLGAAAGTAAEPGVGTVVGAGLGASVASAGTAALGRILGTYNSDGPGMVKDVALDGLLGMAGEGVALGAQKAILPALQRTLSKLGSADVNGAVKSQAAAYLKQFSGIAEHDTMTALTYGDEVGAKIASYTEKAKLPQGLNDAGTIFDSAVNPALAPGSDEAITTAARQDVVAQATKLIGSDGGPQSAQSRLSAKYRGISEDIANAVPENQFIDARAPLSEAIGTMQDTLAPYKILKNVTDENGEMLGYAVEKPNVIAQNLGIDPITANSLGKHLESYMNGAYNILNKSEENKGPQGMKNLFDMIKKSNDLYYSTVDGNPALQDLFQGATSKMRDGLRGAANFDTTIMGNNGQMLNGSQLIAQQAQWYGERMPAVKAAAAAAKSTQATEAMVNKFFQDPARSISGKENFQYLAELLPTKMDADAAYKGLRVASSAQAFAKAVPKTNAIGGTSVMSKLGNIGRSPQNSFKTMQTGLKGMASFSSTMRRMSEGTRKMTLSDPSAFGALMSTGVANMAGYDPSKQ